MWPWVIGWMSMNATMVSSWWTKLASASPLTIWQNTQSTAIATKLSQEARRPVWLIPRGWGAKPPPAQPRGCARIRWSQIPRAARRAARRQAASWRRRRWRRPPSPPAPPVPAMRPGEALHLRPDAHPLAGCDHGAHAGHQPVLLRVLEQRSEQLGRAADDGLRVADDDQQLLGARDGHVDAVGVVEESDRCAVVGPHERQDDAVGLAALERIHRLDVVWRHDAFERRLQAVDLRVVHRDHSELRLAHAPADDRRDVLAERDLELVGDRALRVAVLVLSPRVDPHQFAVEGPR